MAISELRSGNPSGASHDFSERGPAEERGASGGGGNAPSSTSGTSQTKKATDPVEEQGTPAVPTPVNVSSVDGLGLESAFLMVLMDRLSGLKDDLMAQVQRIKLANAEKKAYGEKLNQIDHLMQEWQASGSSNESDAKDLSTKDGYPHDDYTVKIDDQGNVTLNPTDSKPETGTVSMSMAQLKTIQETLKGRVDSLNTDSEVDMLRLQDLFGKYQTGFQLASKGLENLNQVSKSIIQNMA